MRIWDVDPGYLNRQSLLGEHRELHGIVSILVNGKRGYAKHPETLRWKGYGWALRQRHRQLSCEMALRGYRDRSPVKTRSRPGEWPHWYIDTPAGQLAILEDKYKNREGGRIPLPTNSQQLWAQHKYSVMARSQAVYKRTGRMVAQDKIPFSELVLLLTETLRQPPTLAGIRNSVDHMWGYVADSMSGIRYASALPGQKFRIVQQLACTKEQTYIVHSTALAELAAWL